MGARECSNLPNFGGFWSVNLIIISTICCCDFKAVEYCFIDHECELNWLCDSWCID